MDIVYSATRGTNADLFPRVLKLYVPPGAIIADVTYGKGVFWQKVEKSLYELVATDIMSGVDLRDLPYLEGTVDVLVLDPPYAHDIVSIPKMRKQYNIRHRTGREHVQDLYFKGMEEAYRVLKNHSILILKCQDEVHGKKQCFNHIEYLLYGESLGFKCVDLFVLLQSGKPPIRHKHQRHARKNHSYFLVFKKGHGLITKRKRCNGNKCITDYVKGESNE